MTKEEFDSTVNQGFVRLLCVFVLLIVLYCCAKVGVRYFELESGGESVKLNYGAYPVCIAKTPVDDLNESEQNKAIVKPILDARQALGQAQPQARPMLQAAKQEPERHEPDPRVVESFASLRARFEQRKMQETTAKEQAVKLAAINMLEALSNG